MKQPVRFWPKKMSMPYAFCETCDTRIIHWDPDLRKEDGEWVTYMTCLTCLGKE